MKSLLMSVAFGCLLCGTSAGLVAQARPLGVVPAPPAEIEEAFRLGSAKVLTKRLSKAVYISMGGETSKRYDRKSATRFLKDFFQQNPPLNYLKVHHGLSSENQLYYIALYTTSRTQYRLYLLMKGKKKNYQIHSIDISEEKE